MNTSAFVLTVPAIHPSLRKSTVLGRSVASRVCIVQNRRTHLPTFTCVLSDQPTGEQVESVEQVPLADESKAAVPDIDGGNTSAETIPEETIVEESAVEENTVEDVVAQADESISDQESTAEDVIVQADEPVSDQESSVEDVVIQADESISDEESTTEDVVAQADESVSDHNQESTVEDVVTQTDKSVTAQKSPDENVVTQADKSVSDQADQSSPQDSKVEGQKKRRRRSRKRNITLPLEQITVGMELEGTVKSITDYGAFIGDMGTPTDGLLHVSQLAAGYVENVKDVVSVGEKVKVRVLNVDVEKGNLSLTRKTVEQLEADSQPKVNRKEAAREAAAAKREELNKRWDEFTFDPEVFVDAKVMSVTDFGGFCQLVDENGEPLASCPTDGLIHISELSSERVAKVSDVITEGQIVKVRVTSTDRKRNRISMSLRPIADASSNEDGASSFSAGMANAEKNQPVFKTSFELAFERARAAAKKK